MARTKQTAKKSTGGKAPARQLCSSDARSSQAASQRPAGGEGAPVRGPRERSHANAWAEGITPPPAIAPSQRHCGIACEATIGFRDIETTEMTQPACF